jgi:hypothetical protein
MRNMEPENEDSILAELSSEDEFASGIEPGLGLQLRLQDPSDAVEDPSLERSSLDATGLNEPVLGERPDSAKQLRSERPDIKEEPALDDAGLPEASGVGAKPGLEENRGLGDESWVENVTNGATGKNRDTQITSFSNPLYDPDRSENCGADTGTADHLHGATNLPESS